MHLEIQDFLSKTPFDQAIETLSELGIDSHLEEYKNKKYLHLDYSIFADKTSKMVKECRGLVLEKDTWKIVRFGFYRFLNLDETGRDPIDFNSPLRYEEKVDGSLICAHSLDGEWICGTRGRVFPDSFVNGYSVTFPDLFWSIFKNKAKLNHNTCYLFELWHPANRIVINYQTPQTVLIGARDVNTWHELTSSELDEIAVDLGVRRPESHHFKDVKDCIEYIEKKDFLGEGFVIVQWNKELDRYVRCKIKSSQYVSLHNILSARSLGNMVKLVINDQRAILNDFPEFIPTYDLVKELFDKFKLEVKVWYDKFIYILESPTYVGDFKKRRKDFAQAVMTQSFGNICFSLADNKVKDMDDWLKKQDTRSGIKGLIDRFDLKKLVGNSWNIYENTDQDI